ncbi:hypothetical protein Salat_2115800 [Sesamum alatum]|uniref:Uncharacterized protein n=1 Tax=Sesamum alatum TaxID=300844 RepID=A0AAE2CGX4_9LAMI|nr:hypothetical protein Salat_2115800 [Sesamum alatum]
MDRGGGSYKTNPNRRKGYRDENMRKEKWIKNTTVAAMGIKPTKIFGIQMTMAGESRKEEENARGRVAATKKTKASDGVRVDGGDDGGTTLRPGHCGDGVQSRTTARRGGLTQTDGMRLRDSDRRAAMRGSKRECVVAMRRCEYAGKVRRLTELEMRFLYGTTARWRQKWQSGW